MTSRFVISPTPLAGLMVVQRKPISDQRGLFERLFCAEELAAANILIPVLQANRSITVRKGTVRGMHFQHPPHVETKLVCCLTGKVFDVVVDLRRGSPTFLRWHAEELSADNHKSLLIPPGFAHGLQTMADNCALLYFHSAAYAADAEDGVHPSDARIGITWPLPIVEMSLRDRSHPVLPGNFEGLDP
jgi:dTDP-4-dehydrorhamnose 3,5-epimerase